MSNPLAKYGHWLIDRNECGWYAEHDSGEWQTPPLSTQDAVRHYIDTLEERK